MTTLLTNKRGSLSYLDVFRIQKNSFSFFYQLNFWCVVVFFAKMSADSLDSLSSLSDEDIVYCSQKGHKGSVISSSASIRKKSVSDASDDSTLLRIPSSAPPCAKLKRRKLHKTHDLSGTSCNINCNNSVQMIFLFLKRLHQFIITDRKLLLFKHMMKLQARRHRHQHQQQRTAHYH